MKNILILKPRLDVMFKQGPVPKERGAIEPIRQHWKKFVDDLANEHEERGDVVKVLELPNWQFTPDIVEKLKPSRVYIPHKQSHQFPVNKKYDPHYYMQMVFPWLFQIDSQGWGPDSSVHPIKPWSTSDTSLGDLYGKLRDRQIAGESKFDQPRMDGFSGPATWEHHDYVFFPCQIPHDETIRFHSKVSVAEALQATVDYCKLSSIELIIKGHPVNPGSMEELREIGKGYLWADNVNINSLLAQSSCCVMVNSGVGMEAILHGKPVVIFGDADYISVVHQVPRLDATVDTIDSALGTIPDIGAYRGFINSYFDIMYDTTDPASFRKLN
jgi:hypothetical protein